MKPLTGLLPAAFTPLKPDGSLDLEHVAPMVDHLVAQGASGLYVCGSTGEGPSLTTEERKAVAEEFVKSSASRIPVVVQVGHNSLTDARDLARHANEIGADAISAVAPTYFKPDSIDSLIACIQETLIDTPDLPFYYYHIPPLTGINFDMPNFLKRASEKIPSLVGLKFSSPKIDELQACIELDGGRFNVLFGVDQMLLSGLAIGVKGAVGSTYNFMAPLYLKIMEAFSESRLDEAKSLQDIVISQVDAINAHRGIPGLKAAMKISGFDCGPVRLPHQTLSSVEYKELAAQLDTMEFAKPSAASS